MANSVLLYSHSIIDTGDFFSRIRTKKKEVLMKQVKVKRNTDLQTDSQTDRQTDQPTEKKTMISLL